MSKPCKFELAMQLAEGPMHPARIAQILGVHRATVAYWRRCYYAKKAQEYRAMGYSVIEMARILGTSDCEIRMHEYAAQKPPPYPEEMDLEPEIDEVALENELRFLVTCAVMNVHPKHFTSPKKPKKRRPDKRREGPFNRKRKPFSR